MHGSGRGLIFALLLTGASLWTVGGAQAIEPDAPRKLISAEEAVLIAVRKRLQDVSVPSRPTQHEKGDAIDRKGLAGFYAAEIDIATPAIRRPLWVTEAGVTNRAKAALREIANASEWGLPPGDFDIPSGTEIDRDALSPRDLIDLEMRVSLAILKYARYARGGRMDPTDLSLDIDMAPPLLSAATVLNGAIEADDVAEYLRGLHPQHDQFVKLRRAYLRALDEEADRRASGTTGKKRETRLSKRLLYNMEMWRWMPEDLGDIYIMPNVPEYRIRVVRGNRIVHSERMVVGKPANKTPIFTDELEQVVFWPNWGIPNSIKVKEILPKLRRGRSLESLGYRASYGGREVDSSSINWNRVDIRNYHVFQPPGKRNALGIVKFLFPNKHAVYFHDTPSKYLFKKKRRAYSHGCMRVRDPLKLATVIFSEDRDWNRAKIDQLIDARQNNNPINLNRKIPVHVTYFTARADEDGEIRLVDDIYGHEKLIQLGFDGKAHTVVKPDRSLDKYLGDRVGSNNVAESRPRRERSRAWMRRVWGTDY